MHGRRLGHGTFDQMLPPKTKGTKREGKQVLKHFQTMKSLCGKTQLGYRGHYVGEKNDVEEKVAHTQLKIHLAATNKYNPGGK